MCVCMHLLSTIITPSIFLPIILSSEMAEQFTTMVLKVNLQCSKCSKKVKKLLCKIPEIRDQVYDEKNNKVTIKVVSCCPEEIKKKLYCKGGKSIKCIEIKPPEQPKPKPESDQPEKPHQVIICLHSPPPPPPPHPIPFGVCCGECYEGRVGGPCEHLGYRRPRCYDGYYQRPVYEYSCCEVENSSACTIM